MVLLLEDTLFDNNFLCFSYALQVRHEAVQRSSLCGPDGSSLIVLLA